MKKSELREIIKEEILKEDSFQDLKKVLDNLLQNYTPGTVMSSIGSSIDDLYSDKKITASYVKKAIAALSTVQKRLQKTIKK